jgi:hypothetical protein
MQNYDFVVVRLLSSNKFLQKTFNFMQLTNNHVVELNVV